MLPTPACIAGLTAPASMDSETPTQAPAQRYFTWDEVAQRSGHEKERWLVIDRKVYNISEFSRRHPGGSRVISHYAGQDATVSAASPRHGSGRGRAAVAGGRVLEAGSLAPRDELTTHSGRSQQAPSIPVAHDLARDARAGEWPWKRARIRTVGMEAGNVPTQRTAPPARVRSVSGRVLGRQT